MSRIETTQRTLFEYSELSDTAQEAARAWYCEGVGETFSCHGDQPSEDTLTIAGILGVVFETQNVNRMGGGTRQEPRVWWSIHPAQCGFDGRYSYRKGCAQKIREYAPKDETLHKIADTLAKVQRRAFYGIETHCSARDSHCMTTESQVRLPGDDYRETTAAQDSTVQEALRDFAQWIARQIESEYEFQTSDEMAQEGIEANSYEFDESGAIA